MNLAIVTAIDGRYNMTKAFLTACDRIKYETGVQTYAAITPEDRCLELIPWHDVRYIEYKNKPVGEKFNAAVKMLRDTDFTHMMILGSDDLVSTPFIEHALTLDEFDISGIDGLWFWGLNPRRAGFKSFGFFPVNKVYAGPGKIISRRLVEAVDYEVWPPACNYGMDAKMMVKIRDAVRRNKLSLKHHRYSLSETGGFLIDIKYDHHISSLSPITRRDYDTLLKKHPSKDEEQIAKIAYRRKDPYEILPQHLPWEECDYLFNLLDETEKAHEESRKRS